MDHPHPAVRLGVSVADGPGAILAAVVGQDQLEIGELLVQHAVHTAAEGGLGIIDGNNHADTRFHKSTPTH